jgi:FixJ family two-component response regulator
MPSLCERKLIVCIVEDDPVMSEALTDLLESAGFQSMAFISGEKFIDSNAVEICDVIVTDIQMPGLDGLGMLRWLTEDVHSSIPVIVITALADESLERRAFQQGCYAFLRKPLDLDTLIARVRGASGMQ